jgi:hypothetical protein
MNHFFPTILVTYLLPFRQAFYQPGWQYFQGWIWAVLLSGGRKCVTRIARTCFFMDRSLASWERFLAEQQWDMTQVMYSLVGLLQQELGETLKYAGRYVIAVDPTYVTKVKGRMLGVQRWREHSANPDRQTQVTGHQWMLGGLVAKLGPQWCCLPVWSRLVSGKQHPSHYGVSATGEVSPMTIWETALAVVSQAQTMLAGTPLCVVMDAYFAKACMVNALRDVGVTLITRLRHDAVGWDDPVYGGRGRPPKRGRQWALADLWKATGGGVGGHAGGVAPGCDRQGARGGCGGCETPLLTGLYGFDPDRSTDSRTVCRPLFARTGDSRPEKVFGPEGLSSHDHGRVLSFRPLELRGLLSGTPAAPSGACGGLAA